jgi:hypothetical protein
MIKITYFGFLLIILLSCRNFNKGNSKPEPNEEITSVLTIDSVKNKKAIFEEKDIDIYNVACSFYDWYIKLINKRDTLTSLNITKGENNNCTLKNFDKYLNSIKSLGTLTENFIKFEYQRLFKCKQYLESLSWCFCDTSTYYEITDYTPCENAFNFWLHNTQEVINDFEIIKFNKTDSSANLVVAFYTVINEKRYPQYFEAEESLIKEGDKWLIDKIVTRIRQ